MCINIIWKERNTMWHVLTWFGNLFLFSLSLWSHLVFFFFLHLEKRLSGEKCSGIFKGSLQVSIPPFSVCLEKKKKCCQSLPGRGGASCLKANQREDLLFLLPNIAIGVFSMACLHWAGGYLPNVGWRGKKHMESREAWSLFGKSRFG